MPHKHGSEQTQTKRFPRWKIAIILGFLFALVWGVYSVNQYQPSTATSSTPLSPPFYANMSNGCLISNPENRMLYAFYQVSITKADHIPIQYEAAYAMVTSVTYADGKHSGLYVFPKHLVAGPVYGTGIMFNISVSLNGTTYGRPNATVVSGPLLFSVVVQNSSGGNTTDVADLQSGEVSIFTSALPRCGSGISISNVLLSSTTESTPIMLLTKNRVQNSNQTTT